MANKSLVLTGESGVGKSSFVSVLLKPLFGTANIELDQQFQPLATTSELVQILCSPDNAKVRTLYRMTLIPNGEEQIQIKYRDSPLTLKYKSMVILSNHSPDKIRELMEPEYHARFFRRLYLADIAQDRELLECPYTPVNDLDIPNELRLFHFWKHVLRVRMRHDNSVDPAVREAKLEKRSTEEFLASEEMKGKYNSYVEKVTKRYAQKPN